MLESGDLIFVRENTEMGQAIQASTGNYSHVAIFLDGQVYHATVEGGVLAQASEDFFEAGKVYDLYRYAAIDCPEIKSGRKPFRVSLQCVLLSRWKRFLLFPSSSLNYFLSLKPFP